MNPSVLIAAWTRLRVDSATTSGRLSTLDTVPTETPARAATSLMLTGASATASSCGVSVMCQLERVKPACPHSVCPGRLQDERPFYAGRRPFHDRGGSVVAG